MAFSFSEALKPKHGSKHLSTIVNAEGKLVQVETREDELQKVRYQEIIESLVNAGYFRAQIKGLSQFDKVVGGMSWCIDMCNMDLDIDILFQENSSIGQKIALTEKIVVALQKMKCPHIIEPHQIQGLDFIHIHPVIEYLVKKSLENREERGDFLKLYAVHCCNKVCPFPDEKPDQDFIDKALPNVKAAQNKYGPQRKYRMVGNKKPMDTMSRIRTTLFEYGYNPAEDDKGSESEEETEKEAIDKAKLNELMENMKIAATDVKVAAGTVSSIVNLQAAEIKKAVQDYSTLQEQIQLDPKLEINKLKEKEAVLLEEKERVSASLVEAIQKLEKLRDISQPPIIDRELTDEEQRKLAQLEALIHVNESLEEQEAKFKEQCKVELVRLQQLLKEAKEMEESSVQVDSDDGLEQLMGEVAQGRMKLAAVTRSVCSLHRLLDQVPSRAELAQYQRRFLELYNQVSAKHKETKQFYTLYNTLSDTHRYLTKELSLLNSILEGYNETLNSSPSVREEFIKQFESIVDGVKQNKAKTQQKLNEEREQKERLRSQLLVLLDQQRQYASILKQFTAECRLNQTLITELNALSGK